MNKMRTIVKVVIILTVTILYSSFICCQRPSTLSALIKDIIENEQISSVLFAITCWSKIDDIKMIKSIPIFVQISKFTNQINLPIDETTNKQWFFIDMNCDCSSNFLLNVENKYFAHPYRWIIADSTVNSIQNVTFLPDSNVILANRGQSNNTYYLKQVYKIANNYSLIYEDFGHWSLDKGLIDLRSTRILSKRRRNLRGHQLVGATVFMKKGSENYTDLDDYRHNMADPFSKIALLITNDWIHTVNATMRLDIHRTWGYKNSTTGQFSGMSGQLQRKEADIGATIMFLSIDRVGILEYLTMEIPAINTFILRPPPLSYVSNIYYLSFSDAVWACSISLIIISISIIALTLKFQRDTDEAATNMRASDYFIFAVASICQMNVNIYTKVVSARISMLILFIALLFIYISFTANIVALLQSTSKAFRTIDDLQNPLISIGVLETPYNRYFFKSETEPTRKRLYDTKIAPPNGPEAFMNVSHGISRVRQGMFAFNVITALGYREVERTFLEVEKCGLVEIRFMGDTNTWSVIQKHSPYKEILKVNMMKMREHGIQQRQLLRMDIKRPKCQPGGNYRSVRLMDCYMAVLIFICGLLASFIILSVEIFIQLCPFKVTIGIRKRHSQTGLISGNNFSY